MIEHSGGVRGVFVTVLTWTVVWTFPAFVIEGLLNLGVRMSWANQVDMWPQTLGIPGLVAGLMFLTILRIVEGRPGVAAASFARAAVLGAVAGLLSGGLVTAMWGPDPLEATALILGVAAVLGTAAGIASVVVYRFATRKGNAAGA